MTKFLTATAVFLLGAALALAVGQDPVAAIVCGVAGGLTSAAAVVAYGFELTRDLDADYGPGSFGAPVASRLVPSPVRVGSTGVSEPTRRPRSKRKRRVVAVAMLAFPFAYPLSRGPAVYLEAAGWLHPVVEEVVYTPIVAAREQGWLPGWYSDYLLECGKAGRRAADVRANRVIVDSASR